MQPKPAAFLPNHGSFGQRPVFDARQVADLMRQAAVDPGAVDAFVAAFQHFHHRPL